MYNPKSHKAEEFINHEEILKTLDYAEKNKDILTVMKRLDAFAQENGWSEKYADALEHMYVDHILITAINRLEQQKNKQKGKVIRYLRKEVWKRYPHFYKDKAVTQMPKNRQAIAFLNAIGLSNISKCILFIKTKI